MVTADDLKSAPPDLVAAWRASLTDDEWAALETDWSFWSRPEQRLPPGAWVVWLLMGGRGVGKSRTGAETVRQWVDSGARHIALVGKTPAEVRDVMIANPLKSGLLDVFPPAQRPVYVPSKAYVRFHTGAIAKIYSGEEPGALRGPGHDKAWVDELPKFQYPDETWSNLMLGLRSGALPQCVLTTTPLPTKLMRSIIADPQTVLTRGTTYDNLDNLAPAFRERILRMYENTRLGRQELLGELLEDVEGALWTWSMFSRIEREPETTERVVAVDPAVSDNEDSAETGIVVAGRQSTGRGVVLADLSGRYSPSEWANKAIDAYDALGCSCIVCEVNNGGDLVVHTVRTAAQARGLFVRVIKVNASRGKQTRAEPVAMLYEQHRVDHLGDLNTLEEQLTTWTPRTGERSPDRMDALVWAMTRLFVLRRGALTADAIEETTDKPKSLTTAPPPSPVPLYGVFPSDRFVR